MGFCAKCGRPLEPGRSLPPLCLDCFLETRRLLCVPERLTVDYCKQCGSVRYGYRWLPGGELGEAARVYLERYLAERVSPCIEAVAGYRLVAIEPLTSPSWRTLYKIIYAVQLRGVDGEAEQGYLLELRLNPTLCPLCKDARGGDYNVLLQIRGESPHVLASKLEPLMNSSDQVLGSIVDIVEKRNGVDMMLLDRGSASKILRELRKHYRVRVKVTGEDVGVTARGLLRRRTVISVHVSRRGRRR